MQLAIIIALYNTNNCFTREGAVLFGVPSYMCLLRNSLRNLVYDKNKKMYGSSAVACNVVIAIHVLWIVVKAG